MSIKTMQVVSSETKVCESCRGAYYSWKKKNPEFSEILSQIEQEVSNDVDSSAVNIVFRLKLFYLSFVSDCIG